MGSERRKYSRISTDQVISYALVEESDQLAVSKNVSAGGISFEAVGCEIAQGETLRVTFNVGTQTIVAVGRVSWATETDPITTEVIRNGYNATAEDGLGNNLGNILCLDMAVKDIFRLNNQDRAQFTKAVAAGLFYRYCVRQFPGLNFLA